MAKYFNVQSLIPEKRLYSLGWKAEIQCVTTDMTHQLNKNPNTVSNIVNVFQSLEL